MKKLNFPVLMVCSAVLVVALAVYLTKQPSLTGEKQKACAGCEAKKGRSPQGAGIGPAASPGFIENYEQDITDEPYFPGEFLFSGTSWNEVFKEKGESFAVYSAAYERGSAIKSIRIIPLKFNLGTDSPLLQGLKGYLETAFSSKVAVQRNVKLPDDCYNKERKQYDANRILSGLMQNPWVHRETNLNVFLMRDDMYASGLNFVFGYADYVNHVSLVSLHRLKSKDKKLTLRRLLKIMRHEIAHMYGLVHCTSPYCVMRGVNSLEELDASTLSMCNSCSAKLAWRLGDDGSERSRNLSAFYLKKFPGLFQ